MRIHIIAPSISPLGSLGIDTLGMMRALRTRGYDFRVYVGDPNRTDESGALPLENYGAEARSSSGDILIYQHGIGWPQGDRLVRSTSNLTVIRYHNVTPAGFFSGYYKTLESACALGAVATRRFARTPKLWFWPASAFNRDQLVQAGAPLSRCPVVPPFHAIELFAAEPPDCSISEQFAGARTKLLFVSAMAPHKGHIRGLRILSEYRRKHDPSARLIFAGMSYEGSSVYAREVQQEKERLGLNGAVIFAKNLTGGQMRELYARADVLLCLSEHEGFGIPLVEAMHFGLPVVAWGRTAVPDTVGDAGIVLETFEEAAFAAAIHELMRDPEKRRVLTDLGRERYLRLFETTVIERQLMEALSQLPVAR